MENEHEINRADEIDQGTRRIRSADQSASQNLNHLLGGELGRRWDAAVIRTKGVELVGVGRGDKRFAKTLADLYCPPVRVKKTSPEMTKLDRVEAIDSFHQSFADGTA